jgi:methylthioribose-1-phosphate isomerase
MTELPATIEWRDGVVRLLDQRLLPADVRFFDATTVAQLCEAITSLAIRGAPALGAAGAMGVALASVTGTSLTEAAAQLKATRPTAVNLAWGVDRALAAADPVAEALALANEDVERNRRIGANGAHLVPQGGRVLTHCNAGALACVGYGTAIGVIRSAWDEGRLAAVWADETRPVLQGSRLTAWELQQLGIPVTVIADGMAASLMKSGEVDCVIVGADRIARNGDVANKVGTYGLAVAAAYHGLPFYVAAPRSTIDLDCSSGDDIPVERRPADEVAVVGDRRLVPEGVAVDNRAFDITPALLVTAVITEDGVVRAPYDFIEGADVRAAAAQVP